MSIITPEQSKRFGQLLSMGIPLPIAAAIAIDPEAAKAGAIEGVQLFNKGASAVLSARDQLIEDPVKAKRKLSAYNRKYKAAFKKVAATYKKKNGQWKTNGFRSAVRAAHKLAKK